MTSLIDDNDENEAIDDDDDIGFLNLYDISEQETNFENFHIIEKKRIYHANSSSSNSTNQNDEYDENDMIQVMKRLGDVTSFSSIVSSCNIEQIICEINYRQKIVYSHMGSMAQCRGKNGDYLREVGAIHAMLSLISCLMTLEIRFCGGTTHTSASMMNVKSTKNQNNDNWYNSLHQQSLHSIYRLLPNINHEQKSSSSNESSSYTFDSFSNHFDNMQSQKLMNNDNRTTISQEQISTLHECTLNLLITIFSSLRDLACGNANNRRAIGFFTKNEDTGNSAINGGSNSIPVENKGGEKDQQYHQNHGLEIIVWFVQRLDKLSWRSILSLPEFAHLICHNDIDASSPELKPTRRGMLELRLYTNVIGVVRNITHSTKIICENLHHDFLLTNLFASKLKLREKEEEDGKEDSSIQNHNLTTATTTTTTINDNPKHNNVDENSSTIKNSNKSHHHPTLPNASSSWREACYRIAGSIINMAEKCDGCARQCAKDEELIYMLLDAWGYRDGRNSSSSQSNNTQNKERKCSSKVVNIDKNKKFIPALLHMGLHNILHEYLQRSDVNTEDEHTQYIDNDLIRISGIILENERIRRISAQRLEMERKQILSSSS